jgi:hypothetical protein
MFADPQSVTINAVPISLPKISTEVNKGIFRAGDKLTALTVSHNYGKRDRHTIRLDLSKVASDPLMAGQSLPVGMSVNLFIDVPLLGYSITEQKQGVDGFLAYLTASSGANITKLLGGEN